MSGYQGAAPASSTEPVLVVDDLCVAFPNRDGGYTEAVRGVSFKLGRERLGIVGESGSGKSQTGRAILGLTAPEGRVTAKRLAFQGTDLMHCSAQQRRALRGGRIAMVLQDPKFSLNPVMTIGAQLRETLRRHQGLAAGAADVLVLKPATLGGPAAALQVAAQARSAGVGGWGGGTSVWMYNDSPGTVAHELGHCFGLMHANFWDTGGASAIGPGSNLEYGDIFDIMGSSSSNFPRNHLNAQAKNQVRWLPNDFVQTITASGTYRLHAFDQAQLDPTKRYALKLTKDAQRTYWAELRALIDAENKWVANGVLLAQPKGRAFEKELRPHRANSEKPYLVQSIDGREQAQFIVQRIRGLIDEGCALADIAVLYRAHFHALDIQLELSRLQIPYQITSGVRFFEQAHIRDLIALLRFVYNPADTAAWNRVAVLLPKVGDKNAQKIHAAAADHARLMQKDFLEALGTDDVATKVPKDAKEEWPQFIASLQQVGDVMKNMKPHNAVEIAIDGWYGDYLKGAYSNYISRLDDLKSMIGFASRYDDMHQLLVEVMLLNSETSDRSANPDADALRLTTVHQSKGLEYAAVFLIGLADGMFPIRRSIEAGDVEEERRLFYVAVTRARDELYLCYPKVNTKGGPAMLLTPSRFLTELSPDLYQPLKIKRSYGW